MDKNGKPRYNEIIFSQDQLQDIIQKYQSGLSSVKIGKIYGVGYQTILKALRQNNIDIDQKRFVRKFALNETYFDNIDTPNKAYVLGFLYADGNNGIEKGTVCLCLQEDDKEILERIRNEIGSEKPLVFLDKSNKHDFGYTYKNQYGLYMYSTHMCKSLVDKGVVPNKSLITTFPEWLDHNLLPHFVRGIFDGDGSICQYCRNQNNHQILITITATERFCTVLQDICKNILNINAGIYDASCHNGITKVFTLSGRNVCKVFLDWIYKDADLFMLRKYERFCNYYNLNNSLSA